MKLFIALLLSFPLFSQEPIVTSQRWNLVIPGIVDTNNSKLLILVAPQKPGVLAVRLIAEVTTDGVTIKFDEKHDLTGNGTLFVISIPPSTGSWSIKRKIIEIVEGESFETTEVK